MENRNIVEWSNRYSVGIPLIDEQHQKLISITNTLYLGCLKGDEKARAYFMQAIHEAVDYVRYHFSAEEKLMERIDYPDLVNHKKQHDEFVKEILLEVQAFEDGKKFVPNIFVRYLRDWVLTHIAISDKHYADYLMALKKHGTLFKLFMKTNQAEMNAYGLTTS
jgi:hemerythrin